MAELDLANALAQQAAGGGRKRRGGAVGAASAGPVAGPGKPWQPLRLGRDFRVGAATQNALQNVATTMNRTLRPEGLVVNVSSPQQGSGELPVFVAEARGGKVVRAYDSPEFLSMFAKQRQLNGVIVDGQA
ncbi:MAG TPA: hypothetical protein VHP58_06300 [Alphaproteobacteria bacterium]|nr:hypothetical protein [Alphaproteobacteria bacterium]